jgi:Xaa-Pro aminopeptidase
VLDPVLYVEHAGERIVVLPSVEALRVDDPSGTLSVRTAEELGLLELVAEGIPRDEIDTRFVVVACRALGVRVAAVPADLPLGIAEALRADGVELHVDDRRFRARRRVKTPAQLAGIRRAQAAAEAGMAAAATLLREARPDGSGVLVVDGEPLTCERLQTLLRLVAVEHGAAVEDVICSHGPQTAIGHHEGSGPILAGEPVIIDVWPRDIRSGCHADMTRTFCVGEPPAWLVEWHAHCREALERARAAVRPGVVGRDLHAATSAFFEGLGFATQRSAPGTTDGFAWALGHGVGLEAHEEPGLGRLPGPPLVAGDVVAIEPSLVRGGTGGCRLEDLLLVTEDGSETLTDYPYDLAP